MEEPSGGTPSEDTTRGEYTRCWSLNYAKCTVYLARKIMEREVFRLEKIKFSEKINYMKKFRKDLTQVLSEHYANRPRPYSGI